MVASSIKRTSHHSFIQEEDETKAEEDNQEVFEEEEEEVIQPNYRNDLENPKWIEDKIFKDKHDYDKDNGKVDYLTGEEIDFWKNLISKYLTPFEKKFSRKDFKKKAAETKRELYEYRDSFIFGFLMINCFYIVLITMLQVTNQSPICS